jgi:outer membrane protein assembly factor BamB
MKRRLTGFTSQRWRRLGGAAVLIMAAVICTRLIANDSFAAVTAVTGPALRIITTVPAGVAQGRPGGFSHIQVDDSFGARDMLRTARRLVASGHLTQAVRTFQQIARKDGQSVIARPDGTYESVRKFIWTHLLRIPAVQHGLYDQIYGLPAQQALMQAKQRGSLFALTSASERYFATNAAAKALYYIAARQFERGRFATAVRLWIQLLSHPAMASKKPELLHDAAVAAWLAGEKALAGRLVEQLAKNYPGATGMISGRKINLLMDARAVMKARSPFQRAEKAGAWPTFQGNFRRNRVAAHGTLPVAIMWNKPLRTFTPGNSSNPATVQFQNQLRQFLPAFGLTVDPATGKTSGDVLFSFPTCRNGVLYLNLQDRIKAVDINSGYTLWKYPRGKLPAGNATANLATMINELDHYSCTLANGKIYTVLAGPGGPRQFPTQFGMMSASLQVLCLNAANGARVWQTSAAKLLPGQTGRNVWPACIPMATGHAVFLVMAATQPGTGMNELSLVRLNAQSGRVQWTHYLCTITGPAYGISPFNSINIIPAMTENTLYISTALGADMALSANSGDVRWLHINKAAFTPFTNLQYGIVHRTPPWQINAPVIRGSRLITMDNGFGSQSRIHIYNRLNGKKLLSLPCRLFHQATMLLGVIHGNMLLAGNRVCAVNIKTGKQMWASVPIRNFGTLSGRPFLTEKHIAIPLNTGMLLVNTANGAIDTMARWPAGNSDPSGNLLVTAHEVVVVNDHLAAGYARWSDALAYLTGRIKAAPNKPEPYLTLSEVAFRSGHDILARKMIQQAVALALPRKAISAEANRIFQVCMTFAAISGKKAAPNADELFFLKKASMIARVPQQQVQWRMAMANCYLSQSNAGKAINLLEQILAHATLRAAPVDYRGVTLAAAAAARAMIQTQVIKKYGPKVYAPWEQQAGKLLAKARKGRSSTLLEQIVVQYPNSSAAQRCARLLAKDFAASGRWGHAYDMLLRARTAGTETKADKAWQLSRLCSALVHLRHYNQALVLADRGSGQFPTYKWTGSKIWTFANYATLIKTTAPRSGLYHRAHLQAKAGTRLTVSGAIAGHLLEPLEHSPRYRHYNLFLTGKKIDNGYQIAALHPGDLKPLWHSTIAGASRAMLLGYVKTLAILATSRRILALSTRNGKIIWTQSLMPALARHGLLAPPANAPMPGMQRIVMMRNGMMISPGIPGYNILSPKLAAQWRVAAIQRGLGATAFRLVKLLPCGLVAAGHGKLMLYHANTGKAAWKHPASLHQYGHLALVRQTRHYIAAAVDFPIDNIVLINRRTGHVAGALPVNARDQFYWMQADPAGRIVLCGQRGAAMYDPAISMSAPIWSRNDLHDPFPTAASLTVDGLIMPTATGMACMNITSGAIRWNQPGLHAGLSSIGTIWMQTALNHNTLVMLTPRSLMAISTRTGDIAWKAEFVMQTRPPLTAAQIGNPDIVAMANGPVGPVPNVMHLYLIDQKDRQGRLDNGSIVLDQQLTRSNHDATAPEIESWLLVNGGILFQVNGVIFYCHT